MTMAIDPIALYNDLESIRLALALTAGDIDDALDEPEGDYDTVYWQQQRAINARALEAVERWQAAALDATPDAPTEP